VSDFDDIRRRAEQLKRDHSRRTLEQERCLELIRTFVKWAVRKQVPGWPRLGAPWCGGMWALWIFRRDVYHSQVLRVSPSGKPVAFGPGVVEKGVRHFLFVDAKGSLYIAREMSGKRGEFDHDRERYYGDPPISLSQLKEEIASYVSKHGDWP
jgi:hypothetical protein